MQTDSRQLTSYASYPLAAIVGLNRARRALLLLATDPGLKGLLISAKAGSAKSVLARSARALFSSASKDAAPFVEVPVNATPDMLIAGVDVERTLSRSTKVIRKGLLARADGGLLYADGINLMSDELVNHIAAALGSGFVTAERDGISARLPATFALIGTYDRAEGAVSPAILDRVALIVDADEERESEEREEIIRRALSFEKDAGAFIEEYLTETKRAIDAVKRARRLLPRVRIERDDICRLSMISMRMGVEGNRADIFAVRAMRASAALEGRDRVREKDMLAAIELVLAPRARAASVPPECDQQQNEKNREEEGDTPPNDARDFDPPGANTRQPNPADLIIEPRDSAIPDFQFSLNRNQARRVRPGKRADSHNARSGRYVGSTPAGSTCARIAVDATLRASAPYQKARRTQNTRPGAVAIRIKPSDLRYKKFRRRSGMLFVFVVDASGSMAANRMAQAKGALMRLLEKAYLHRDQVSLISFQRSVARVLLQPTRSVASARLAVEAVPAGGATPLAAGLLRGLDTIRIARLQGAGKAMMIVLTDGRANIALSDKTDEKIDSRTHILDELKEVGLALAKESVASIIIDTKSSFLSTGEARTLADTIGAEYFYLPRADGSGVFDAVSRVAGQLRR